MNRAIVLCLLLIAAPRGGLAQAPDPGVAGEAPVACTSRLHGHVVDVATHEAIPGAVVRVDDRIVGETDRTGHFVVTGLCPGARLLEVERADYLVDRRTIALGARVSVELELVAFDDEVIVVEAEAPGPVDMRSTAVLAGEALERTRGRGLAEALAEVPGVSQLRSATGMGKPIIRGQFGRRLLLLVDGIRHRAQEWGLEHAPEIDPFAAASITVVRGASGVRYGPDAIGGAVLVEPPALLREPGHAGELHLIGSTNAPGGTLAGRIQAAPADVPGLAWQLEGSVKRLAAARTPDYPLDNTGVAEWNAGATVGYRRRGTAYKLSYRRYQAQLGVCSCLSISSVDHFEAQIARDRPLGAELYTSDFEIERPYQAVVHDLAIARGEWTWDGRGTLTATYAFQHDHRREYDVVRDAVTGPQFDFRLFTHELAVAFEHNPIHLSDHLHLRGSTGLVGVAQTHAYTGLPLVPDHTSLGTGVYALERLIGHDVELEAGVRYDLLARTASIERRDYLRIVRSGQLALDACGGDGDPVECASRFHSLSASLGGLYRLTDAWTAKLDLSTAARPPNPDEQYLNGTSPTLPGARARQARSPARDHVRRLGDDRGQDRAGDRGGVGLRQPDLGLHLLRARARRERRADLRRADPRHVSAVLDARDRRAVLRRRWRDQRRAGPGARARGAGLDGAREERPRWLLPRVRAAGSGARLGDLPAALAVEPPRRVHHAVRDLRRAPAPVRARLRLRAAAAGVLPARGRGGRRDPRRRAHAQARARRREPPERPLPRLHEPAPLLRRSTGLAARAAALPAPRLLETSLKGSVMRLSTYRRSLVLLGSVALTAGCDHGHGHDPNELINQVRLDFAPTGGGATVTAVFDDPDGDGGAPPTVDPIALASGTSYALTVRFLNTLGTTPEEITDEVRDEGDEHQVFFTGTAVNGPASDQPGAPLTHAYTDQDAGGLPLGLTSSIAATTGTGELTVTLRHLPAVNGVATKTTNLATQARTGGVASLPGSSDANVTFQVTVP